MIDPQPGDEGRAILYQPRSSEPPEDGVVIRWNESFVFVRYSPDPEATPKATARRDLTWWPQRADRPSAIASARNR